MDAEAPPRLTHEVPRPYARLTRWALAAVVVVPIVGALWELLTS